MCVYVYMCLCTNKSLFRPDNLSFLLKVTELNMKSHVTPKKRGLYRYSSNITNFIIITNFILVL